VPTAVVRKVIFFKEDDDSEPVRDWLDELKERRRMVEHSKISTRISRAGQGNFGDHRMLGGAFGELKIDLGPGYRVYFGLDGCELIVLLSGGSKDDQQSDIELAESRWDRYRKENDKEGHHES
jgi:putative addiction module killer protein